MLNFWRKWIPTKNEREVRRLQQILPRIAAGEAELAKLTDSELKEMTAKLKARFADSFQQLQGDAQPSPLGPRDRAEARRQRQRLDAALAPLLPDAFALVREAGRRALGLRHFDVQLLGGATLHEGKIAEMKTGEGKTLVATLPSYLNALTGLGVHVVTVNEYLVSRDAQWMGKLYNALGLTCGIIVSGMRDSERQAAYNCDITYGTNSEFGFDYLRDNMKLYIRDYVQRDLHFAIVDEVDSILIDEARTPLIISGPAEESTEQYVRIGKVIPNLRREQDYIIDEKARSSLLTEQGIARLEGLLGVENLYDPNHIETLHHVNQALRAHALYRRDVDYIVEDGKVKIIDEFTGRVLSGRRWSEGLHQAVEAKEGVAIEKENQTLATITYQNYFRNYLKLAGMTGTAETEAEEFAKIYDLDVVAIPTHRPMVRQDLDDLIFKSEQDKFAHIIEDIKVSQEKGQPTLVGTVSVEKSEVLSAQLSRAGIAHQVLNAKYHQQEAMIIAQAGRLGKVTIATNMAGRGTDILLGGNPEFLTQEELAGKDASAEVYAERLAHYRGQCQAEREQVLAAGGLYILGTERHESRRIDNQLRGRAGRQGDLGASRFYISLEDDLMRIFGGERISTIMERIGMQAGEVIEHPWMNRAIENAQKRVEGHNFDLRKHLLEYDDVMNDQRKTVYRLRRQVLSAQAEGLRELLLDVLEEVVLQAVNEASAKGSNVADWDYGALQNRLSEVAAAQLDLSAAPRSDKGTLELYLYEQLEAALSKQEARYGSEPFFHVAKILYLQTIDTLWKNHLRDMDHLREGISLRGYAQKDPKQEYKKEGYNLFTRMMASIATHVLAQVMRVIITPTTEASLEEKLAAEEAARHQLLAQSEPPAAPPAPASKSAAPSQSSQARVSRNDPCPCGSGLKYKKCHMLLHASSANK